MVSFLEFRLRDLVSLERFVIIQFKTYRQVENKSKRMYEKNANPPHKHGHKQIF